MTMKDKVADIRIAGIENGCVVSVSASNAKKMRDWEKLNSPSANEGRKHSKRADNQFRRMK